MYLYPIWVRLWHVINAVLFLILIVTGLSMQYTGKEDYILVVGFARAVKWHNIAAILLTANFIAFVTGNIVSGNVRYYRISKKNFFSDLGRQFRFYSWKMFKGEKHPFPVTLERKFNPLQKITYVLAMYVAFPLLIISGLGLMFPETIINRFLGISGRGLGRLRLRNIRSAASAERCRKRERPRPGRDAACVPARSVESILRRHHAPSIRGTTRLRRLPGLRRG